ncbi:MAG: cytidine deaminase [Planctomycetes bacterium]|nr:cytidine deaminase [Planctomycetota bacterium]
MTDLSSEDHHLLDAAREIIRLRQRSKRHKIGAALRTRSGRVFRAVNVEAEVGRISVCAEAVAVGMAVAEGDPQISAIVAVRESGEVVPPCGMCRELVLDYAMDAEVVVPGNGGAERVPMADLLPNKFHGGLRDT